MNSYINAQTYIEIIYSVILSVTLINWYFQTAKFLEMTLRSLIKPEL